MLQPKISIVMSTYNRLGKFLPRAIKSILLQTYKEWELIIVDDCSTDGTKEYLKDIVKKYPQIHAYCTPKQSGSDPQPKNIGIKNSIAPYIAFLDDDSEYLADHLMVLVKFAQQNPTIDVVYGDRMIVSDDEDMEPTVGVASDFNQALLVDRNYIDTSDALIKREALFYVGGWDERYKKYVDWNLWVRLTKAQFKFKHIAKVITRYHLHSKMKSINVFTEGDSKIGKIPFGNRTPAPVFKPQWNFFELEIQLPYLGDIQKPKVAVFTLTKNRIEYTKIMFQSLLKAGYPFDWFVVDQGSTDGTVQWLQSLLRLNSLLKKSEYPPIKLILNKKNKGISIGSNQALDAMGEDYDYIIKIDNDAQVGTDNWLTKLLHIYEAHRILVLSPYVEGLVDNPGGCPRIAYKTLRGHLLGITKHIGGIFTMAHKSAYKGFRWDENDTLHSLQDTIFTQDVQKRDFLVCYVEDMKVMHQDTTSGQRIKYPDYFEKRKFEKTHIYE